MKQQCILSCFLILFILSGCRSSETTTAAQGTGTERSNEIITDDKNFHKDLGSYLQLIPGIRVLGSESNRKVMVHGVSSFSMNNEPLFVLDGQVVGNTYSQVQNIINVNDIDNVRVLKGSDATIYGIRGANGVVLITTKK